MKYNSFYTYLPNVPGHTKVHKNSYRGNINRLRKNICQDNINIYTRTSDRLETPLFLAISNDKIDVSNILFDIYEFDLRFIENSIVSCNSTFWRHNPILIGFGDNDIRRVQKLYQEYSDIEPNYISSAKCTVVLLKRNNFTPVQVICLSPKTERGKQIALEIVSSIIENGRLDLNGRVTRNDSLLYASVATGSVIIFNRLCGLGVQQNAIELFITSMHFGRLDMLEMIFNRYAVKIGDVIDNEMFSNSLFASDNVKVCRFVFEKYIAQNKFVNWEFIINLLLNPSGRSVFQLAIINNHFEFAEFCLQHKPDLFKPDSQGYLPIHHVINSEERAKLFVSKMIETNYNLLIIKKPNGGTVLQHMVRSNWIEVIIEIFDKYPNAKTTYFENLHLVLTDFETIIHSKYYEMAELLIIHGQNYLEDTYSIISILNCAINRNCIDLVKIIFNTFKTVLNASNMSIIKPIFSALTHHHLHIYNFIVERTYLNVRAILNENGQNLLHYAIWEKQPRYDDNMPGSLWDSIYRIPDDSEDEEDQKLGLLPTFQCPDENYSDPYEITDEDIAEKASFDLLFDEFIEHGFDFHHTCISNNTLLHRAVQVNNVYVVERLLELGVDVTVFNNDGDQPIHLATNLEIFQILNSWTTNSFINSRNSVTGETPLHKSVGLLPDKIELARYILKHNGDVNAIDNQGKTPIFKVFYTEYVELLLEHQANVNITDIFGNTPIHLAFMHHNPKTVILLFQQPNIDYCAVNNMGTSYLEKLVTCRFNREKPSHGFKSICTLDNPDFRRLLQTHCNTRTANGTTVIGSEDIHNDDVMFDMLLTLPHIDLDVRDNITGNTPLHMAAKCGNARSFHKLIERGISINILNDNNETPLVSCSGYALGIVAEIMQYKPDVNIRNKYEMTAILNAAKTMNNERACSEILAAGGNIFDVDAEGNSAYSMMPVEMKQIFVFLT